MKSPAHNKGPVPQSSRSKLRSEETLAQGQRTSDELTPPASTPPARPEPAREKGVGKSKKRSSKKSKKKGSAGPSRGVVGSGFGGAARPTKSVPKGLVVAETGPGAGDVVDWSTGQQLAEVRYSPVCAAGHELVLVFGVKLYTEAMNAARVRRVCSFVGVTHGGDYVRGNDTSGEQPATN